MVKSCMDAPATDEEAAETSAIDTANRITLEKWDREIAHAKGELTQSEINPDDGCDPRNQRVEDTERDARLRHRDYDEIIDNYTLPLIRQRPDVFTVLRDSVDAGEAAYTLGQLLRNPALADHPKYKDFEPYLRDVASRRTGRFTNTSITDHERDLEDYKAYAEEGETVEEFFTRWR
jgi:hypothetical protein